MYIKNDVKHKSSIPYLCAVLKTPTYEKPIICLSYYRGRFYGRGSLDMELKHYQGKIRRFYLSHFQRNYVENQLEKREGSCKMCGRCCQLGYRCPFLTSRDTCSVYMEHRWMRPAQCGQFPIDQRDMKEMDHPQCGYYFEK